MLTRHVVCFNQSKCTGRSRTCAQPMRGGVTLQRRLSLAGCKSDFSLITKLTQNRHLGRYWKWGSLTLISKVIWPFWLRIPGNGVQRRSCRLIKEGQGVLNVPTCSFEHTSPTGTFFHSHITYIFSREFHCEIIITIQNDLNNDNHPVFPRDTAALFHSIETRVNGRYRHEKTNPPITKNLTGCRSPDLPRI